MCEWLKLSGSWVYQYIYMFRYGGDGAKASIYLSWNTARCYNTSTSTTLITTSTTNVEVAMVMVCNFHSISRSIRELKHKILSIRLCFKKYLCNVFLHIQSEKTYALLIMNWIRRSTWVGKLENLVTILEHHTRTWRCTPKSLLVSVIHANM